MQIYYFSGTGNSLAAAKDMAEIMDAELVSIASLKDSESIELNAETVGIVFPVYYAELPVIVKEFVQKLKVSPGTYLFAVCTHGGAAMASLRQLKRMLLKNGVRLSAAFGVHMPQNAFLKQGEDKVKVLAEWDSKRTFITSKILKRTKGIFYNSILLELLIAPFMPMVRAACRKSFLAQTGLPADTPTDVLVRHLDAGFTVSEECSGCGTCESVCPALNIVMQSGRPEWLHRCENCLACVNWCPSHAIIGGITKGYYYKNPHIKLQDMMRQRPF